MREIVSIFCPAQRRMGVCSCAWADPMTKRDGLTGFLGNRHAYTYTALRRNVGSGKTGNRESSGKRNNARVSDRATPIFTTVQKVLAYIKRQEPVPHPSMTEQSIAALDPARKCSAFAWAGYRLIGPLALAQIHRAIVRVCVMCCVLAWAVRLSVWKRTSPKFTTQFRT